MGIAVNTPVVLPFTGNNTASDFAISFPTFENSDIVAEVEDSLGVITSLVISTDFVLSNIGLVNYNAQLSLVNASQAWLQAGKLKTGYTLRIKFSTDAFQPISNFRSLGNFAPEALIKVVDRLTMFILAIKEFYNSSITIIQTNITNIGTDISGIQAQVDGLQNQVDNLATTTEIKTGDFTAQYGKFYILNGVAGQNIQLPAPVDEGIIEIKLKDYAVNILRSGSEQIDWIAGDLALSSDEEVVKIRTFGGNRYLS